MTGKMDDRRELSGNTAAAYIADHTMRENHTTNGGPRLEDTPTGRRCEVDRCRRYWRAVYGDRVERASRGFGDWHV